MSINQVKVFHSTTRKLKVKCDFCSNEFFNKSTLRRHILQIHSGSASKYGCSLCDVEFKSNTARDYHVVVTHTGEKAFPCELCPAKFSSAHLLKSHQFVHSDEKPHKCTICSRQFKQKQYLAGHIKTVHSQRTKDFGCSTCQKTFYTKTDLSRHARTHATTGGDLLCYFCKKEFAERCHLDRHLRTHTQEKPFVCPDKLCKYACADSSNLRNHMRHHHPSTGDQGIPTKTWRCYFCSKTYPRFHDLVTHFRNHTLEEPFPCGLCKKTFRSGCTLSYHISTHTKEKPFSCPHCGKCFSTGGTLTTHEATHTGEKRFFCDFCSYASFQKREMVRHNLARHQMNC